MFSQQVCSPGGNVGFIPLSGHAWQNGFHGPFINHLCSWTGNSLPAHWPTFLVVSICCFQTEVSTFQQLCLILKKSKQGLQCEVWGLDRLSGPLQECPRVDRWAGAEQGIPAMGPDMHRCNVTHWYLQEERTREHSSLQDERGPLPPGCSAPAFRATSFSFSLVT